MEKDEATRVRYFIIFFERKALLVANEEFAYLLCWQLHYAFLRFITNVAVPVEVETSKHHPSRMKFCCIGLALVHIAPFIFLFL